MAPRLAPVSEKKKTTSTWWMVEVDSRMVVLEQSQVHVTRYVARSTPFEPSASRCAVWPQPHPRLLLFFCDSSSRTPAAAASLGVAVALGECGWGVAITGAPHELLMVAMSPCRAERGVSCVCVCVLRTQRAGDFDVDRAAADPHVRQGGADCHQRPVEHGCAPPPRRGGSQDSAAVRAVRHSTVGADRSIPCSSYFQRLVLVGMAVDLS